MSEFEPPRADEPPEPSTEPPAADAAAQAPVPDAVPAWTPPPAHPIQLIVTDDLRRSRLTVLLRVLLAIPHLVWLSLWGIVAGLAILVAWFAALFTGQVPDGLHNFIARFQRYSTHVTAYLFIAANPFPGFGGNTPYPVDLEVAPAARQSRLSVFFRGLLAIPALILAYLLALALEILAFVTWLVALFLGRIPPGLENMLVLLLTFTTRTNSYLYLLTSKYPSFD
jgi:Domain of unknown function (DUF4389)